MSCMNTYVFICMLFFYDLIPYVLFVFVICALLL